MKQCIEFHYMPKVHFTNRETGMNSLATKRKRLQMVKAKQLHSQKQIYDDDISSSPSCNEFRMVNFSENDMFILTKQILFTLG